MKKKLSDFERHFCHRLLSFRMKRQFTPTLTFYLNDIYVYHPVFYIAMAFLCFVQIISLKLHLSYNFVIARAQERRIDTKIKKKITEDNRMFGKVNDIEFNKPWAFA